MEDFFKERSTDDILPCVAIVESSGCGKSQLAFSAPAGARVLYIPMIRDFHGAQPIYKAFRCISKLMMECVDGDLDSLKIKDKIPTTEQLDMLLEDGKLHLFGLFNALYTHLG
jgi:hypothetical protein